MSHQKSDVSVESLGRMIADSEDKKQLRHAQQYKVELAKEYTRRKEWAKALHLLRSLWQNMTFREEGWWDITEEIGWDLRRAAIEQGDGGSIVAVCWEMLNSCKSSRYPSRTTLIHIAFASHTDWDYSFETSLTGIMTVNFRPAVVIRHQDIHSFLSVTFAFERAECRVGELCTSQMTITSHASSSSLPLTFDQARISFTGGIKTILVKHARDATCSKTQTANVVHTRVALTETASDLPQKSSNNGQPTVLAGESQLSFPAGKTLVLEFSCPLRESGEGRAISATFIMTTEHFDLEYIVDFSPSTTQETWWIGEFERRRVSRRDPSALVILPKPPKMNIHILATHNQFYTDELVLLELGVSNDEDEESDSELTVKLSGTHSSSFTLRFGEPEAFDPEYKFSEQGTFSMGCIQPDGHRKAVICITPAMVPDVYILTAELSYTLASDPATQIFQQRSIRIPIVRAFEANYDFSPRYDTRPWPTFFCHDECGKLDDPTTELPSTTVPEYCGLSQKWCLTTRFASFAEDPLVIEDVGIEILALSGGIRCTTSRVNNREGDSLVIHPSCTEESQFNVFTHKTSLDDRRSAALDLSLFIRWRRDGFESSKSTSRLSVPRLLVAGMEPRVLALATYVLTDPLVISLEYTIENPSLHFLTFALTMSPSESFAYSGVKQSTVQLVPLSRRTIRLNIVPTVRGEWIRPQFLVKDRYFQKILKIAPAEGLKVDKDGILVWVPRDDLDR